jgi:hypothetical protein
LPKADEDLLAAFERLSVEAVRRALGTPVFYAQMGLLPQMHRREPEAYAVIRLLLEAAGRDVPPLESVPNRYLRPKPPIPEA